MDIVITLVFMMAFIAFSIYPAIKIVDFITSKKKISEKMKNFLLLFFTILIAFLAGLFMKMG